MLEVLRKSAGKFTLKAFIVATGWIGLLALIAYIVYKEPQKAIDAFDTLLGAGLSVINIAIGKWLFGGDRSG
jgi:membrane protein DedA with SNARE-associated domain